MNITEGDRVSWTSPNGESHIGEVYEVSALGFFVTDEADPNHSALISYGNIKKLPQRRTGKRALRTVK